MDNAELKEADVERENSATLSVRPELCSVMFNKIEHFVSLCVEDKDIECPGSKPEEREFYRNGKKKKIDTPG